jgi:hypothetical protein
MHASSLQDTLMLTSAELMEVLDHLKSLGCVAHVHAESGDIVAENEKRLLARGITGPGTRLVQSFDHCIYNYLPTTLSFY